MIGCCCCRKCRFRCCQAEFQIGERVCVHGSDRVQPVGHHFGATAVIFHLALVILHLRPNKSSFQISLQIDRETGGPGTSSRQSAVLSFIFPTARCHLSIRPGQFLSILLFILPLVGHTLAFSHSFHYYSAIYKVFANKISKTRNVERKVGEATARWQAATMDVTIKLIAHGRTGNQQ